MDAVTVTFLAVGCFALLLLVLSLVGGHLHVGHMHLDHLHLGHADLGHLGNLHTGGTSGAGNLGPDGQPSGGGLQLTLPVIAGFLGTFGFAGAIAATLTGGGPLAAVLAVLVGLVLGTPAAWLSGRLINAAINMPTDATPTSGDLLGALGVVVTPVPASGGYGEVRVLVAGQQIKLHARADVPLPLGTQVFVIEVSTPTSVLVEPTPGSR
jgi:membrane protein implicated in regulation of membrane protease activity